MGFVSDKKGISNRGIKTYQTHLRETRPKKTNHSGELPPNVKEMGDAKATDPDNPKIAQKSCRCPGHLPVLLNLNLPMPYMLAVEPMGIGYVVPRTSYDS